MPDEASKLAKQGWPDVLAPFTNLIHSLCGPAFTEYGLAWGDAARVFRLRQLKRLLEKTQKRIEEKKINPQAVKFSLLQDIMDRGSLEDNDDLQDRWANLLASASDPDHQSRRIGTFPQILSQLTREEAHYLEEQSDVADKSEAHLLTSYISDEEMSEHPAKLQEADYDNLKRLGLIQELGEFVPAAKTGATPDEILSGRKREYEPLTLEKYGITSLGYEFVQACRSPKKASA
jgi:hypothetical protein